MYPTKAAFKETLESVTTAGEYTILVKGGKRVAVVACPKCGDRVESTKQEFITEIPLQMDPGFECKNGHAFFVRKGELVYQGREDSY